MYQRVRPLVETYDAVFTEQADSHRLTLEARAGQIASLLASTGMKDITTRAKWYEYLDKKLIPRPGAETLEVLLEQMGAVGEALSRRPIDVDLVAHEAAGCATVISQQATSRDVTPGDRGQSLALALADVVSLHWGEILSRSEHPIYWGAHEPSEVLEHVEALLADVDAVTRKYASSQDFGRDAVDVRDILRSPTRPLFQNDIVTFHGAGPGARPHLGKYFAVMTARPGGKTVEVLQTSGGSFADTTYLPMADLRRVTSLPMSVNVVQALALGKSHDGALDPYVAMTHEPQISLVYGNCARCSALFTPMSSPAAPCPKRNSANGAAGSRMAKKRRVRPHSWTS